MARRQRTAELSVDAVVDAAIGLLDDVGIERFTMRALAQRLGCAPMATYRHVGSREELLTLAARAVQHEVPEVSHLPWYERLEAIARHGWWTSWKPHPWVVDLISGEAMTPLEQRRLELMEQTFRDAGFDEDDIRRALVAHWSFVVGTLRFLRTRAAIEGGDTINPDAIFDFNLRAWILGLGAKAADLPPSSFPGRVPARSPGSIDV